VREVDIQRKRKADAVEEALRKSVSTNRLLRRSGAVVVGDARLRAATDKHQRIATTQKENEHIYTRELQQEQSALRGWISGFITARKIWLTNERLRLRIIKTPKKEIQAYTAPFTAQLANKAWLVDQYRKERANRWRHYETERQKAIDEEVAKLGGKRTAKDVTLPLYWQPPGDPPKPRTPWVFNEARKKVADDAITAWLTSKDAGIIPVAKDQPPETEVVDDDEPINPRDDPDWWHPSDRRYTEMNNEDEEYEEYNEDDNDKKGDDEGENVEGYGDSDCEEV
ncbi:hypothetical protein QBC32DRAFT_331022, partial [Pseudoneurospora amorphoporcata]